jgi:hypothetical protein
MSIISKTYISEIKQILREARSKAYTVINSAMVEAYWLIGKRIVEEELDFIINYDIKYRMGSELEGGD